MGNKWIIDVLADLESYAALNGLPLLAAKLDEAAALAVTEIASDSAQSRASAFANGANHRTVSGAARTGGVAR